MARLVEWFTVWLRTIDGCRLMLCLLMMIKWNWAIMVNVEITIYVLDSRVFIESSATFVETKVGIERRVTNEDPNLYFMCHCLQKSE